MGGDGRVVVWLLPERARLLRLLTAARGGGGDDDGAQLQIWRSGVRGEGNLPGPIQARWRGRRRSPHVCCE